MSCNILLLNNDSQYILRQNLNTTILELALKFKRKQNLSKETQEQYWNTTLKL